MKAAGQQSATHFHFIARALIVDAGQILLARERGAKNTFLPGGHIEWGEGAADALQRELHEELGTTCRIGAFLGAAENHWVDEAGSHAEINLVFEAACSALTAGEPVISQEAQLEFLWVQMESTAEYGLLPEALQEIGAAGGDGWRAFWGSDYA
jgi:ADP-ribose pyrophosphatase YjhB (NUDIX family)